MTEYLLLKSHPRQARDGIFSLVVGAKAVFGDKSLVEEATRDFYRLRLREKLRRFLNPFRARHDRLLSFAEVKGILRPASSVYQGMRSVPVKLIVGSEGRYNDFTRSFLPRHDKLRSRWVRVSVAFLGSISPTPVRLYELGGVYFIADGNHRVSVATRQGREFIDAEVTSLGTYFEIRPGMTTAEMEAAVMEYERVRFLSETGFEDVVPGVEMYFTSPGRYDMVLSHIAHGREDLTRLMGRQVTMFEAVRAWYEEVYAPMLRVIQEHGLLRRFPGRTPSDLYVWIMDHWDELRKKLGTDVDLAQAVESFRRSRDPARVRHSWSRARHG